MAYGFQQEDEFRSSSPLRLKYPCNPTANREAWLADLGHVENPEACDGWASSLLAVHGTSVERLESILRDRVLYSHAALKEVHPEVVADRLSNATDTLDEEIGQDEYAFFNVGRVNPGKIHEVYLLFSNTLIEEPDALVAMREIIHFGGIVSPEAGRVHLQNHPHDDIQATNRRAVEAYTQQVFEGRNFRELFRIFLAKHYGPTLNRYITQLLYPGALHRFLQIDGFPVLVNAWEGPQLQMPDEVPLTNHFLGVLVTDANPWALAQIHAMGLLPPEMIFSVKEAAAVYRNYFPPIVDDPNQYPAMVNMALRDLCLMGRHNRYGRTFDHAMFAYRDRS